MRAVALAWLFCQVASLSAFVPGECCKAHAAEAAAKAKQTACHESASAKPTADKPADADQAVTPTDGDACPLHHGQKSHACCTISNGCNGPGQQLTTLFAYVGTIESPQSASIVLVSNAAFVPPAPPLLYHLAIPDAPPPKLNLA